MEVVKDRGYQTQRAVADAIAPVFGVSRKVALNKISYGKQTKEEGEGIGSIFEMTMKEFYDVFMFGLFQVDNAGHYRCHIDEPYLYLHPQLYQSTPSPADRSAQKRKELVEEIQEYDE